MLAWLWLLALLPVPSHGQPLSAAATARFTAGVDALKAGRLDEAEAAFRDVLRGGDDRAFVHHNLGLVLRERQRPEEALVQFRAAVRLDPTFGPAWLMAGAALLALDRPRDAAADLQRATTLMPNQVVAWRALSEAYQRSGDPGGVVAVWRRLAAAEPTDPEAVYRLGRAYLAQSQWAHERLRKVHPMSARVSQALGREYQQQGRPDLALAAYQEAARRAPALSGLHLSMAGILLEQGQVDAAAREVDAELLATPGSAEALALKAKIAAGRPR
jgi:tetratricopeptide (TPR) repeat protein